MARYILKADKRMFPDNPRPNSLTNVYQATYEEIPTLPPGGTTDQVLAKSSNLDYDVYWRTLAYLTAANNGLSLSGTTVQLGGILIKNTTIAGASYNFFITNLGKFAVEADTYSIIANNVFQLRTPGVLNTTATSGQVLKLTNAASGAAEWGDVATNYNVVINAASPYTIVTSKELVVVDTTSGNKEVILKNSPLEGDEVVIKKLGDSNTLTLTAGAGHTIDGASSAVLNTKQQALTVVFDGVSSWVIISKYL